MLTGHELPAVGNPQGPQTQALLQKKQQFVSQGISNLAPIFVESAKGAVIRDIDRNVFIDLYGGIGVINAGHCPESVVEAIKAQADKLLHSCFMVSMYDSYVELAEKLTRITPGDHAKKAMLVNSGAEAVENAVKIARAATGKPGVIAFEAGYHGRTLLTMTLTSKVKPYKHQFGPFAPEIYKIPSAYCYRCIYKSTYPECGLHCLEAFERFFISEVAPDNIAAMIIEPVQGEGGFIVPPQEFLPGLKQICEQNEMLFIADEVQTGFARTGKMFAVEYYGVVPDLITLAKGIASGMPLSAVVGKAEIMDAPTPGRVGGTYGGNPVACAAALATLELMAKEDLCARAETIGATIRGRMQQLQQRYPQIGDIRCLGAMVAIELVKDPKTKAPAKDEVGQIIQACFKRGVLTMGAGIFGNVIRFLPPLVISDSQLAAALDLFELAVAEVLGK